MSNNFVVLEGKFLWECEVEDIDFETGEIILKD